MLLESKVKSTPECVTCNLGADCLYNSVTFSANGKYSVVECNGPDIPRTELRNTDDNSIIQVLQTNDNLRALLDTKKLPQIRYINIPMATYSK